MTEAEIKRLNQIKGLRNFVVVLMPRASFRAQAQADAYAEEYLAKVKPGMGIGVFQIMGDTALRLVHIFTREDEARPEQEVNHG